MAKFEFLSGLPPYGPNAVAFSATGLGKHREGFVVRVFSSPSSSWVGNFQRGLSQLDSVFEHPDGLRLIVIAGGQGYVVNPLKPEDKQYFGGAIEHLVSAPEGVIVFGNGLWFEAIGREGALWQSERVSWDGMKDLQVFEFELRGEAWNAIDQKWEPFQLDLRNGALLSGKVFPEIG